MPAVERAILDLAAIVIRHDLAAADTATHLDALAGKCVAKLAPPGDDEIGRPAIQRCSELARRHARTLDDGFVVPSEKAVRVAELVNPQRPEIVLEELPRAILVERDGRQCTLADVLERIGDRTHIAGWSLAQPSRSAQSTGSYCVSGNLSGSNSALHAAVVSPARPMSSTSRQKTRQCAAIGIIVRLRSQPLSNWDHATRRRARTSTYPLRR